MDVNGCTPSAHNVCRNLHVLWMTMALIGEQIRRHDLCDDLFVVRSLIDHLEPLRLLFEYDRLALWGAHRVGSDAPQP